MIKLYYRKGWGVEKEMQLLKFLVKPGMRSVDVGANHGIYTYLLSDCSDKVYAFEPIAFLYKNLVKAFKGRENVKVFKYALSNKNGTGVLKSPKFYHGCSSLEDGNLIANDLESFDNLQSFEIEIKKFDDLGIKNLGFMKIDVEGHEQSVIEGAKESIRQYKPVLLVEIEERHKQGSVKNVIECVKKISHYKVFFYSGMKLNELSDVIEFTDSNKAKLYTENYINNFIFIHSESEVIKVIAKNGLL